MLGLLIWLSGKQPNRGGYWSLKLFHFRLDFDFDTLSGFAVGHDVEVAINRFAIRSRSQTHGDDMEFSSLLTKLTKNAIVAAFNVDHFKRFFAAENQLLLYYRIGGDGAE